MIKTRLPSGSVLVTFELPTAVTAASVHLCGEFNDWSQVSLPLTRADSGRFSVTVELQAGRQWRFRYLLDGEGWENDWEADDYLPNDHGGDDSVVDLTDTPVLPLAPAPPAEETAAPSAAAGQTRTRKTARPKTSKPPAAAGAAGAAGTAGKAETARKTPKTPKAAAVDKTPESAPAETTSTTSTAPPAQRPRASSRATTRKKPVTPAE